MCEGVRRAAGFGVVERARARGDIVTVEAISVVLHHSKSRGTAKLVMIGIANHDGDGGSWPSMMRLATYAGVDISQVKRALPKLVELGEIEIVGNGGGQVNTPEHMRTNLYKLNVRCPSNCDGTTQHRRLCLECDEPLPFARYRFDRHTRCERQAIDAAVDNYPGALAHRGALAPSTPVRGRPTNLPKTTSTPNNSIPPEVTARESVECEHAWVEHRGVPWRCVECGIAFAELEAGA
jgi:hypothetical protein